MKQDDSDFKKRIRKTGGGTPPDLPKLSEDMEIAASMMGAELNMSQNVVETFVHPIDESSQPILDAVVSTYLHGMIFI